MPATKTEIHVSGLTSLHPRLVSALCSSDLTASELAELFARHVSAACTKCGLRITGEELSQIALAAGAEALADPKLARIRQGYCGRNGCDSYFYTLTLEDHFKVNWDSAVRKLKTQVEAVAKDEPSPESEAYAAAARALRRKRWTRVGIGVAVLLVLLIARHLMYGGRIPILQPKHEYRVNSESYSESPAQPPTVVPTNAQPAR